MIPASNINIKPVIYSKDTNEDYLLDSNNDKIIEKIGNEVSPYDKYEHLITINEDLELYFSNIEIKGIVNA